MHALASRQAMGTARRRCLLSAVVAVIAGATCCTAEGSHCSRMYALYCVCCADSATVRGAVMCCNTATGDCGCVYLVLCVYIPVARPWHESALLRELVRYVYMCMYVCGQCAGVVLPQDPFVAVAMNTL